jgi:hypothetical protein
VAALLGLGPDLVPETIQTDHQPAGDECRPGFGHQVGELAAAVIRRAAGASQQVPQLVGVPEYLVAHLRAQ